MLAKLEIKQSGVRPSQPGVKFTVRMWPLKPKSSTHYSFSYHSFTPLLSRSFHFLHLWLISFPCLWSLDSTVGLWRHQQHHSRRPEETCRWLRGNTDRHRCWLREQSVSVCEEHRLQSCFHQSCGLLWRANTITYGALSHQPRAFTVCTEGKNPRGKSFCFCVDFSLCILELVINLNFQVITVLMKSTQREQNLCQLASALLATIYLFCGDEVSRQQYRRWDLPAFSFLVGLLKC